MQAWNKSRKRLPLKVVINLACLFWSPLSFWIRYCKSYQKWKIIVLTYVLTHLESKTRPLCNGRIFIPPTVSWPVADLWGTYSGRSRILQIGGASTLLFWPFPPKLAWKWTGGGIPGTPPKLDPPMIPVQFLSLSRDQIIEIKKSWIRLGLQLTRILN